MTDQERRRAPRQHVFLAAEIESDEGEVRVAVSRDASETGLLLLTRSDLPVGAHVKLRVMRDDQNKAPIAVSGHVTRSEPLDEEEALLWKRKLGVELENPPKELFDEMRVFAEKQKAFYGS